MTTTTYTCEGCGIAVTRAIGDEGRGRFCSVKCGRAHQVMRGRDERYWQKVIRTEEGCWDWNGTKSSSGYGVLYSGTRRDHHQEFAHRISWEIHNGPIPDGLNVCHHCDNPPCSRPDHLFVGTDAANMLDRDIKGRHGTAKLAARDIRSIRARRAQGERLRSIAEDFGVSDGTISEVARRHSWKHIK